MTVTVENLGGGSGSTFPPQGMQVPNFSDDFNRANADTLGPQWGSMWLMADYPFDAIDRPEPYDASVNPAITGNGLCSWIAGRAPGIGYTAAFPWPLAWMTQAAFNQFAQLRIAYIQSATTTAAPYLFLVFSGNPGTLAGGFYNLGITGSISDPDIIGLSMGLALFGRNPSGTPSGIPGDAGLSFSALQDSPGQVSVDRDAVIRFEARQTGSVWHLTALADGVIVATGSDNRLVQGMPAMGASQFHGVGTNINPLASIDDFEGGWLK